MFYLQFCLYISVLSCVFCVLFLLLDTIFSLLTNTASSIKYENVRGEEWALNSSHILRDRGMKAYVFWTYAIFTLSDVLVVLLWLQVCSQYFIHQQQLHTHCVVELFLTQLLWHLIVLNWFDSPFRQYSVLSSFPALVTSKLMKKVDISLLIIFLP